MASHLGGDDPLGARRRTGWTLSDVCRTVGPDGGVSTVADDAATRCCRPRIRFGAVTVYTYDKNGNLDR